MYDTSIFPAGYVGLGTVGAATWWYLFDEDGPQVSFYQLVSCETLSYTVFLLCLQQHNLIPKISFSLGYIWIWSSPSLLSNTAMFGDPSSVQK